MTLTQGNPCGQQIVNHFQYVMICQTALDHLIRIGPVTPSGFMCTGTFDQQFWLPVKIS
jgi:hypothetical protein